VGAIANEAGLDSKYIGRIEIFDEHSVLDLPDGMPKEVFDQLKAVWVAGKQLQISPAGGQPVRADRSADQKVTLSVPKKGGDRRVSERKFGDKAPFKAKSGSDHRSNDGKKHAPKPGHKGPKRT